MTAPSADEHDRPAVSPRAQRLATDAAVELDGLTGSGAGGRVREADVLARIEPPAAAPGDTARLRRTIDASQLRRTIARLETNSHPGEVAPQPGDVLLKALAAVLPAFPQVAGVGPAVELAVAQVCPQWLAWPVIRDVGRLSLRDVAARRRDLQDLAAAGRLPPLPAAMPAAAAIDAGGWRLDGLAIPRPPQLAASASLGRLRAAARDADDGGFAADLELAFDAHTIRPATAVDLVDELAALLEDPAWIVLV